MVPCGEQERRFARIFRELRRESAFERVNTVGSVCRDLQKTAVTKKDIGRHAIRRSRGAGATTRAGEEGLVFRLGWAMSDGSSTHRLGLKPPQTAAVDRPGSRWRIGNTCANFPLGKGNYLFHRPPSTLPRWLRQAR